MRYRAGESLLVRALGPLRVGLSTCLLGLPPLTVLCSHGRGQAPEISIVSVGGSEDTAPAQTQAGSVDAPS